MAAIPFTRLPRRLPMTTAPTPHPGQNTLRTWLHHHPSTAGLGWLSLLALIANLLATRWLQASYALSRFPVPYHEAQLSFSAVRLKQWYAQLIEWGTLDVYLRTQYIDHVFIATVLVLHVAVLLWVSRLFPASHRGRRLLVGAALLSTVAPLADTLENLVSYGMLANPAGFPDALAWGYSGLAAIKFALFTFAYVAVPLGVVTGLLVRFKAPSAAPAPAHCP